MKEHIGKTCKITVNFRNKNLFYTAKILNITDTHITFKDKFSIIYTYKISDIKEINGGI